MYDLYSQAPDFPFDLSQEQAAQKDTTVDSQDTLSRIDSQSPSMMPLLSTEEKQAALHNFIEELRSLKVTGEINLPQMVVCGDQSSGKSSVLRRLTGVPFPVHNNLCTRFPTRVIMRRTDDTSIRASIEHRPFSRPRTPEELSTLEQFERTSSDLEATAAFIQAATAVMGLGTGPEDRHFCADTLCLELCWPSALNMTVVDLPGLFLYGAGEGQSTEDGRFVREMVLDFCVQKHTIVLAIVPADQQTANQQTLQFLQEHRKEITQVFGILTKADRITDPQDDCEAFRMLKGHHVELDHQWHVLAGGPSDASSSFWALAEDNKTKLLTEKEFFGGDAWKGHPDHQKGMPTLQERGVSMQFELSSRSFSDIQEQLVQHIAAVNAQLAELTKQPETTRTRSLLVRLSLHLQTRTNSILNTKGKVVGDERMSLLYNLAQISSAFQAAMVRARADVFKCGNEVRDLYSVVPDEVRDTLARKAQLHIEQERCNPGQLDKLVIAELYKPCISKWADATQAYSSSARIAVEDCVRAVLEERDEVESIQRGFWQHIATPLLDGKLNKFFRTHSQRADIATQDSSRVKISDDVYSLVAQVRSTCAAKLCREQLESVSFMRTKVSDGIDTETMLSRFQSLMAESVKETTSMEAVACMCSHYQREYGKLLDDLSIENVKDLVVDVCSDMCRLEDILDADSSVVNDICTANKVDGGSQAILGAKKRRLNEALKLTNQLGDIGVVRGPSKRPYADDGPTLADDMSLEPRMKKAKISW